MPAVTTQPHSRSTGKPRKRSSATAALLAISLAAASAVWAQSGVDAERERAVKAAREGQLETAISALQRLAAEHPDRKSLFDLAVILTWANRNADAVRVYEENRLAADAPEYVAGAIARAYRALRKFDDAERIALKALTERPGTADWTILHALLLTDLKRADAAEKLLMPLFEREPDNSEVWLAAGYAARELREPYRALRAYAQVLRLRPDNAEAARAQAQILVELGAPFAAAGTSPQPPFATRAREAAALVRWGAHVRPSSPAGHFDGTDAALKRLDSLIAEGNAAVPRDVETLRMLERDRAVALRNRERWADTLAAVAALRAAGDPIPPYVRLAEADALLALQRPREARRAYQDVAKSGEQVRDARVGLFFAEVEDEDFKAAFATIDALAAESGPRRAASNARRAEPDGDWLDAQILAANARHYADMNAEAWSRMLPLAQGAPALGYLRSATGAIAAARGWPRRADEEIRIAYSLAPEDRGIQIALADSELRRRDAAAAKLRAAALAQSYPDDPAVQRLTRDIAIADMRELRFNASGRREYGTATAAPGGGSQIATRLYSSPFAGNWRAVAAAERATASPPEGRVVRDRAGVGAEYNGADLTLELIGWENHGAVSKTGASAIGAWRPDDHWAVYAGAEAYSADTPLRAQFYGITANAFDIGAEYRWHESRSVAASIRTLEFSDGNRRQSARVVFAQRIIDRPRFDLTVRPEFYTSRNSLAGAPYFNPASDQALTLALDAEHVIWRHYDRSWTQRLIVSGGNYWQEGFGGGGIYTANYEQRYRFSPTFEIRYGIEGNRRIYDGTPERAVTAFIGLNKRF